MMTLRLIVDVRKRTRLAINTCVSEYYGNHLNLKRLKTLRFMIFFAKKTPGECGRVAFSFVK